MRRFLERSQIAGARDPAVPLWGPAPEKREQGLEEQLFLAPVRGGSAHSSRGRGQPEPRGWWRVRKHSAARPHEGASLSRTQGGHADTCCCVVSLQDSALGEIGRSQSDEYCTVLFI